MYFVAVLGIGGTHFHYAAGTTTGELRTDIRTEHTSATNLADQVHDAIAELRAAVPGQIGAVAVASKGLVDRTTGSIELMDIAGGGTLQDVPLADHIAEVVDGPVFLENDCAGAALAEYHFGAGVGHESIVHVTMGTGIGAGVIDQGRLVRGASNHAGEVGSIVVGPADGMRWCDIPGAWEAYCSGPGIAEVVRRRLDVETRETRLREATDAADPTPRIFEVAESGDVVAREYLDDIARLNARGIATVANLYDPGLITLGGGVASNNPDFAVEQTKAHLGDFIVGKPPELCLTTIDNMGIYGALAQVVHDENALLPSPGGSRRPVPDTSDD